MKAPAKRTAKTKEPKAPKQPKSPKLPKDPKPSAPCKPAAGRKTQVAKRLKDSGASGLAGTKRKKNDEGKKDDIAGEDKEKKQTDCPDEETAEESGPSVRMKEEVRHTHMHTKQDEIELATISNIFQCFFKNDLASLFPVFFLVFIEGVIYRVRSPSGGQMGRRRVITTWA